MEVTSLKNLEEQMSRIPWRNPGNIRPGKYVAALFDGLYCRAKVAARHPSRAYAWNVLFVDYGNRASVLEKDMAQLPHDLSLKNCREMARRCQLAALRSPPRNTRFFGIAGGHFAGLLMPRPAASANNDLSENKKSAPTLTKEWKIRILYDEWRRNRWHVVLTDQTTNVNEQMTKEGHTRFDKKEKDAPRELFALEDSFTKEYLKTVKKLNDEAFQARLGMWESGDIESEEEELL